MSKETTNEKKLNYIEIGQRLAAKRDELGLTQEAFAEKIRMEANHYGRAERGECGLSLIKVYLLYDAYGIDPLYLLTGERSEEASEAELLENCPREKRFEIEQALYHALRLAGGKE